MSCVDGASRFLAGFPASRRPPAITTAPSAALVCSARPTSMPSSTSRAVKCRVAVQQLSRHRGAAGCTDAAHLGRSAHRAGCRPRRERSGVFRAAPGPVRCPTHRPGLDEHPDRPEGLGPTSGTCQGDHELGVESLGSGCRKPGSAIRESDARSHQGNPASDPIKTEQCVTQPFKLRHEGVAQHL